MAHSSLIKRVGAGAITGAVALLACNNNLQYDDEPESAPRHHPLPGLTSSTPTAPPSRKPTSSKAKKLNTIIRRATAFCKEVKGVPSKHATFPNKSHNSRSRANSTRSALDRAISTAVKLRKPSSRASPTSAPSPATGSSDDLAAESSNEAVVRDIPSIDDTNDTTNGQVDFVQTSAIILVDTATQTNETEFMCNSQIESSQNSPVENEFQADSSCEESRVEGQQSSMPLTPDTVQSDSASESNSAATISRLEEEIVRLHRLNYNLNERAVDLETSEEVLDDEIRQLRQEREEFERDAEHLRGRLQRLEAEHEDKVIAEIEAHERSRKYNLQQIQDHYQTGAWQGLAQNMKLQLEVKEQKAIIKGQQQLLEGLKKNTARQAVVSMADSLQEARLELITYARQTYQLNNEITFLKTRFHDTEHAQHLLPQIEEQVRRLLEERETLQHQLNSLQRQQHQPPTLRTSGLNDGVFRGFNN